MPVFRFNRAVGLAREVKAFVNNKRIKSKSKRIKSKKQELKQIRDELRAVKEPVERTEHQKRKKRKKQEIFQLERELRAAKERAEGISNGRPAELVVGESETGALPDFVIIGAKKCGTTSLYHLLIRHPHVEPAAMKEPGYFSSHSEEGIEWYRRCFPPPRWKDGRRSITGEATPEYLFHPFVPERMAEVVPQARLIALLRNPIDRAYSDYHQTARQGLETRTLEEAIEAEMSWLLGKKDETSKYEERTNLGHGLNYGYLSRGVYVDQLLHWSKFFDSEQMLVLKSEDFFERTPDTLKLVLDFLDLPDWDPEAWEVRKKGEYKQEMDLAIRQRLKDYFEPHNQRLYEYLGVNFGW